MYSNQQPRTNFVTHRQTVPQNIQQRPQSHLMASSPANIGNMYQQPMQTTMFMAPNQASYMRAGSQVITMSGPQIPSVQQQYGAQYPGMSPQYTINTNQQAQYAVTPSPAYYPVQQSAVNNTAMYYNPMSTANISASQSSGISSQPPTQQNLQQPSVQQQQHQPQAIQTQRPSSQPASQGPYQKQKRKGLAIIDPNTGKDISQELAPTGQKAPIPVQPTLVANDVTPVIANTPVAPQPSSSISQSTDIAAQFAAQVAATLTPASQKPDVVLSHQQPTVTSHELSTSVSADRQTVSSKLEQDVGQPKLATPTTIKQTVAVSHSEVITSSGVSAIPVTVSKSSYSQAEPVEAVSKVIPSAVALPPTKQNLPAEIKVEEKSIQQQTDSATTKNQLNMGSEQQASCETKVSMQQNNHVMVKPALSTVTNSSNTQQQKQPESNIVDTSSTSIKQTIEISPQVPIPIVSVTQSTPQEVKPTTSENEKTVPTKQIIVTEKVETPNTIQAESLPVIEDQTVNSKLTEAVSEGETVKMAEGDQLIKDNLVIKETDIDVESTKLHVENEVENKVANVTDSVLIDESKPITQEPVLEESSTTENEKSSSSNNPKLPDVVEPLLSKETKSKANTLESTLEEIKSSESENTNEPDSKSGELSDDKNENESQDDADEMKSLDLKYEYKEDQWSPINMEGKKTYDRQFLLKMQYDQQSVTKPFGLPDLPELILETPNRQGQNENQFRRADMGNMDFTPGYIKGVVNQRTGMPMPRKSSREQQRGNRSEPRKVISINREPEVVLIKAENPYKPSYKQAKETTAPTEETKVEELYRKIRSILNKLTPQKFQTLMQQILDLNIDTEEKLKGTIDIIFEKAIDEPAFSVAYANACKIMAAQVTVTSSTNPQEKVTFKKLLLNRCQTEFEKDKSEAIDLEKMQAAIDAADSKEQKKILQEEKNLAEFKAKRRSLGNIRFIGELFKLNMLTERIMHDCIMNLLKSTDEESLECLCRLVATIGKSLDHEKAKPLMDQYFAKIDKIIKSKGPSARTRFMLQDLQDLRLCKWKPRRDDNAPKTIEQIHKEAAEEKVEKQALHARLAQQQRSLPQGGPRGGRSADEHGWQAVGPVRPNRIDPSKMKISKPTVVDENITLGPGRSFGGWGRGSTGGGRNASQESEKPSTPANRFSALSGGSNPNAASSSVESDPRRNQMGTRGGRESRGRLTPRNSRNLRGSQEKERDAAIQAVRNLNPGSRVDGRLTPSNSRNQSRESSSSRDNRELEKTVVTVQKEMSKETIDRKTKSTIDEYLSIHDLKEAIECVKEIPPSLMHCFADVAIQHVLERSDVARRMTGGLLHDLVKNEVLSVDQYLQGLKETLEFAEDMEIDIPKIWQYLGELIGPMVQDGSVPLSFLKQACEPLLASNKAGILVSEVLKDATLRLGLIKVGEQWKNSGLQWTDFMGTENVGKFIETNKLEYTLDLEQEPLSPVGKGLSDEKIQVELNRLIQEKKVGNELVFDWVATNVGDSNTKKPAFIRALMTSVCSSAINGPVEKATVDISCVKLRGALLQRYMDHDAVLELQALYALQALVHKLMHPPDVLRILFDTLYDEDIISEDAFNQWESSEDPKEQAGKGVARSSVVQFYRWLREAVEEEQ